MMFHRAVRTLGFSARPLFQHFTPPVASQFLRAAIFTRFQPTRLSSSSSDPSDPLPETVTPPWQISDLSSLEQKAYKEHGTNYLEHIDPANRRTAMRRMKSRKKLQTILEQEYGDDWYPFLKEVNRRWDAEVEKPKMAEFDRRKALLGPVVDPIKPPPEHRQLAADILTWHKTKHLEKINFRKQVQEEMGKQASSTAA